MNLPMNKPSKTPMKTPVSKPVRSQVRGTVDAVRANRPLLVGLLVALALLLTPLEASTAQHDSEAAAVAPAVASKGLHLHATGPRRTASVPKVRHVFVINIENKGFDETWGPTSAAPYLAEHLRNKGVLLDNYYGTAHNSESNYVAQISGQGPNLDMQSDCQTFGDFKATGHGDLGQLRGSGCVFPRSVNSLPQQLTRRHLRWKGYMDDMDTACEHPAVNGQDHTQSARVGHQYATRHDPFVYFHSIIDNQRYCAAHVVKLTALRHDLRKPSRTPNLAYLTPDLCNDGHDAPCVDGRPGGLRSVNAWMKVWVPRILRSKAFKRDGMLVITADESDGPQDDSTACCDETALNTPMAGITGAGGGRIGALVISRWTKPGTYATAEYNHYSLLGSLETVFHVAKLGYARAKGLDTFGLDVFNSGWNDKRRHRHHHSR